MQTLLIALLGFFLSVPGVWPVPPTHDHKPRVHDLREIGRHKPHVPKPGHGIVTSAASAVRR